MIKYMHVTKKMAFNDGSFFAERSLIFFFTKKHASHDAIRTLVEPWNQIKKHIFANWIKQKVREN